MANKRLNSWQFARRVGHVPNSIGYFKAVDNFVSFNFFSVRKSSSFLLLILSVLLFSCTSNDIVDSNISIEENEWTYAKSAKSVIEITDTVKTYNIYFKLRHTADYRYSNLYAIFRLKGNGINERKRYQFKVAQADGQWLGKGSGDLFTHQFPLLTRFRFPKAGKYQLELEQNMRDNPLIGISDIGLKVAATE